jgi:hypothetical protein
MNLFDIGTNDSKPKTRQLDYLKLVEGPNRIRLWNLDGESYGTHWHQGKKRTFKCPVDDCPQCQSGNKAKRKYIVPAIHRKDNQPKIFEFGDQVLSALRKIQKELEPDDSIFNYDLIIFQNPRGSNPLYSVSLKQNMTGTNRYAEDLALIADFNADLKVYVRKTEAESESQESKDQGPESNYDPNEDYK